MKENMIDFDTSSHHGALCVIAFYILAMLVKTISYTLANVDAVLELVLHLFQFALTIAGLIAFWWTWNERQKKKRNRPI